MGASSERRVTLLWPGLFVGPAALEEERPTGAPARLETLLVRADRASGGPTGFEARLLGVFGVAAAADHDLPVAPVTRFVDMGVIDREWWVRADPVYLEAGHDSLVLHAGLDLTQTEAASLADEINAILAPDGWLLKAPKPSRWYLKPPQAAQIRTTALSDASERDVKELLPGGPESRLWRTRLSELQILLHTSSVNAAREARGQLPANSVWFWGGGRLPDLGAVDWTRVWSNEPLATGLARLTDVPTESLPANAQEWLHLARPTGNDLVVLDQPWLAQRTGGGSGQEDRWSLVSDWVTPLMAAVHAGSLTSLKVLSDRGPAFSYRRAHRWRFWRHRKPLSSWQEAS